MALTDLVANDDGTDTRQVGGGGEWELAQGVVDTDPKQEE
jgi:hypothetical protein